MQNLFFFSLFQCFVTDQSQQNITDKHKILKDKNDIYYFKWSSSCEEKNDKDEQLEMLLCYPQIRYGWIFVLPKKAVGLLQMWSLGECLQTDSVIS